MRMIMSSQSVLRPSSGQEVGRIKVHFDGNDLKNEEAQEEKRGRVYRHHNYVLQP